MLNAARHQVGLFVFIFFLIGLWSFVKAYFVVPDYLIPAPSEVIKSLWSDREILWQHSQITIWEWFLGIGLSVIVGFLFAFLLFASPWVRAIFRPILMALQSIPYLVFAPLLLVWLGLGILPKIILVVVSCSFPIAVVLEKGMTQARTDYQMTVVVAKLNFWRACWHVYLPGSLGDLFSGLRIAVSYAFVSCVMSELVGSEMGLGVYLTRAQSSYRIDKVLAATLIIVLFTYCSAKAVDFLRRCTMHWER